MRIEVVHKATDHQIEFDISRYLEEVKIVLYDRSGKIEAILRVPTGQEAQLTGQHGDRAVFFKLPKEE